MQPRVIKPPVVLMVLLAVATIGTGHAAVRHVSSSAVGPAHDGTSWVSAYTNLQSALATAGAGDEIWVAAGVYKPTETTNRTVSFVLRTGVALYGGFPSNGGNGTFTARNPNLISNRTILSGDIDNNDLNLDGNHIAEHTGQIQGNNSLHILKSDAPVSSNTIVDGFILTAGNANGIAADSGGGAFRNVNGSGPTLRKLRFEGNGGVTGAAIYNEAASPILEDILFVNNRTTGTNGGGGMRNVAGAHPTLARVEFVSNIAFRGGGMHNSGNCNPVLTDVIFVVNSGINMGGGIYNENSSPQLNRVEFYGNAGNFGVAVANASNSRAVFINCLFRDNHANQRGGAIYNSFSDPRFVNCTFSQNDADDSGGAMDNLFSAPMLQNCIFWGNTTARTNLSQIGGSVIGGLSTNNLIQGGYSPLSEAVVSTANPLFVNADADDFRLQPNSPAAGAGSDHLVPAGVTTDLDGNPRIVPLAVDLGAYESQHLSFNPQPTPIAIDTLPTNSPFTFTNWIPGGTGLTVSFDHLASSGDVAFLVPPSVGPDGTLSFTLVPGTSGQALFHLRLVDLNGIFAPSPPVSFSIPVSKLVANVYPRVSFDYIASRIGPSPGPTARAAARIRGYRHPAGQRKGVAIFPGAFGAEVPVFPPGSNEVIHPVTGALPTNGSPLEGTAQLVWSEEFDVYTLDWHDPRTYLQANAMVLVDVLNQMATAGFPIAPDQTESLAPGEKAVIVGNSMGGLISRFALCYLDKLQIPYRCDLFLSMDSPQEGAYIPVGLQHLAVYLDNLSSDYKDGFDTSTLTSVMDAINQPSPRQMLLLHHSRSALSTPPYYAQERTDFLSLLQTHGNWPTNQALRMAAISNGRGDGFFEERDGVGDFSWPKPDRDLRIIDWTTTNKVYDDTSYLTHPGLALCFWGSLRIAVTGYLATTVYALNPSNPFEASQVFRGIASATISVTGRNTNVFNEVIVSTGTQEINTSGTDEEIRVRLREFIRQAGGLTGIGCDAAGLFQLNQEIENAVDKFIPKITEIRDLNQVITARSGERWDWLPGGWGDKGDAAAAALGSAGTVSRVSRFHCFVPTVSALALSDFIPPQGVAIPANAADLSPFHALYHFGARANTGHLTDFNGWLSDIISHELRMLCGDFKLRIGSAPLRPVTWRGAYTLQTSAEPTGPWGGLFRAQDGVYIPATPLPDRNFFRLHFSHVYR